MRDVLRLPEGERVQMFDGQGHLAVAMVEAAAAASSGSPRRRPLVLRPLSHSSVPAPELELTLIQAVIKGARMDWLVEKATELGVDRLVPLVTSRTIVRPGRGDKGRKVERWQRIVLGASRQCGRAWLPTVEPLTDVRGLADRAPAFDLLLVGALEAGAAALGPVVREARSAGLQRVGVVIGPEGDLDDTELTTLREAGARFVSLGERVLRAETAGLFALSILDYELRQ